MHHVKENFNEGINEIHTHIDIKTKPSDKERILPEGRERKCIVLTMTKEMHFANKKIMVHNSQKLKNRMMDYEIWQKNIPNMAYT